MNKVIALATLLFVTTVSAQTRPKYEILNPTISLNTYRSAISNSGINKQQQFPGAKALPAALYSKDEKHFKNIRQLTNAGENAEAYFSPDGKHLTFQARGEGDGHCDQIYTMNTDGTNVKEISTGYGRTTCSYYFPKGDRLLYSSTFQVNSNCPGEPDHTKGYVWPLYPSYDIYIADTNGLTLGQFTVDTTYYDAEATISPVGNRIVYTSTKGKDIDLYSMNLDGTDIKRLTTEIGYDGGAFYSYDGSKIVYRASHPEGTALEEYKALLKQHLIRPTALEIMVMDSDGANKKQVTRNGKANFCPFFFPNGKKIIFASNMDDPQGREFDIYSVNIDGSGLERITFTQGFDGFPMFSPDGKQIVWCSNRNGSHPGNTNIFIADWVD